jgi:hypothetical protein
MWTLAEMAKKYTIKCKKGLDNTLVRVYNELG